MNDGLSNSKRKFIENWRQTVSIFMESGNICRTTIAEMTPEPNGPVFLRRVPGESNDNLPEPLKIEDVGSPVLPAVKYSYCHAEDDVTKQERKDSRRHHDSHRERRSNMKSTTLPPSPNGVMVQNGGDMPVVYNKRKHVLRSVENKMGKAEPQDLNAARMATNTRNSTKTAREIYEKYNMKSQTHNMLMGNHSEHGVYTMPWRNKTFLSLPLRFNGNIPRKQKSASRQSAVHSEFKFDDFSETDDIKFTRDWTDIGF